MIERIRKDPTEIREVRIFNHDSELVGRFKPEDAAWTGAIDGKKLNFSNLRELATFVRGVGYSFKKLAAADLVAERNAQQQTDDAEKIAARIVWLAWKEYAPRLGPPSHLLLAGAWKHPVATVTQAIVEKGADPFYWVTMHVPGFKKDIKADTVQAAKETAERLMVRFARSIMEQNPNKSKPAQE